MSKNSCMPLRLMTRTATGFVHQRANHVIHLLVDAHYSHPVAANGHLQPVFVAET